MADAEEERVKAERLAAAKKRVEQMKKKKMKKGGGKEEEKEKAEPVTEASNSEEKPEPTPEPEAEPQEPASVDEKKEEMSVEVNEAKDEEEKVAELGAARHGRSPSLSVQSKMRSSSFRQASGPLSPEIAFSPSGDTAPDIYRKQAIRIEELERENKKLAKEAGDAEKRWKKAEEELEDLREADGESTKGEKESGGASSEELEKLKLELAALQRQNTQLQVQASRGTRHGSSPSMSITNAPSDLEAELRSKSSTIESMEIEISNLSAQLDRVRSGSSVEKEQISALEDKLARSEKAAANAQRELGDVKKNLERITEKAVKEGSERTSAETKLRTLEKEAEDAKTHSEELQKKVEALEKKVQTLTTLHKEHDARSQAQKKEREKIEKEAADLKSRLANAENENARLKEERERLKKRDAQGIDDDGVDELENEERQRLEKKVRDLEAEVHELRRGVWRERRRELEGEEDGGGTSPGARFTDVDLGSGSGLYGRRKSLAQGKGIGDFLTSGFNAITGGTAPVGAGEEDDDGLLDDDDELEFDEEAFRAAQEEEMKKRIERIKEIKRGLKNWEGWRLDLVENRRGGGEGVGEIFEV
ncbi:hypothetical protein CJF32_00007536 [Rutstroemia sp. NJR-2017a WRK4]|nr:hypothetical protein CJF32_00007536 [Rutstroemia sp. NJR-2017a WRK4]